MRPGPTNLFASIGWSSPEGSLPLQLFLQQLADQGGVGLAFGGFHDLALEEIQGGGFAGLYAAQALRRAPVHVMLVDRRNFHLFQPLLYQVATGGLSPGEIAAPLRSALRKQSNAEVLMETLTDIDPANPDKCDRSPSG